jgi:nicotinamide-nucleotide amidase
LKVEVINTGTELLLGNVVNTHLSWMARQIFPFGLRISRQVTVPDGAAIRSALLEAMPRCDLLLVTGGLGPTTDDLTREITAQLLGLPLLHHAETLERIQERCRRRGFSMRERMGRQAMVPEGAVVLRNDNGTAPGLYLPPVETPSWASPHIFLLPGPPRELYPMFEDSVLPLLRGLVPDKADFAMRSYRVVGLGESAVEEMIGLELDQHPLLEVGYCARPNEVDFRLIGPMELLEGEHARIVGLLGDNLVCLGESPMEEVVVSLLRSKGWTVATAESCTGGALGHRLTNVPGASEVFLQGAITYSNESKTRLAGVDRALIQEHGAVSAPVALAMARGIRERSGTSLGVSTTGIAGPSGGSEEKPVGTVFIGVSGPGGIDEVHHECFPMDRVSFKKVATQAALDHLRRRILHS